jgi:hypothetical protein
MASHFWPSVTHNAAWAVCPCLPALATDLQLQLEDTTRTTTRTTHHNTHHAPCVSNPLASDVQEYITGPSSVLAVVRLSLLSCPIYLSGRLLTMLACATACTAYFPARPHPLANPSLLLLLSAPSLVGGIRPIVQSCAISTSVYAVQDMRHPQSPGGKCVQSCPRAQIQAHQPPHHYALHVAN